MGRPKSTDPYCVHREVWMRQSDWDEVHALMEAAGYRSFAAFARDRMLSRRTSLPVPTGTESDPGVKRLVAAFSRIGRNYNQVTRAVNGIVAKGLPCGTASLERKLEKLCELTESLRSELSLSFHRPPEFRE